MPQFFDLTGQTFERLTVLGRSGSSPAMERMWRCRCECGNESRVATGALRRGRIRSCGCLRVDLLIERFTIAANLRFKGRYTINEHGCWIWKSSARISRYASFYMNNRRMGAHKASWLLFNGEIPEGLHVLHKCDVPLCVNPEHLFLGTHADNMADMAAKGRARSGRSLRSPVNAAIF